MSVSIEMEEMTGLLPVEEAGRGASEVGRRVGKAAGGAKMEEMVALLAAEEAGGAGEAGGVGDAAGGVGEAELEELTGLLAAVEAGVVEESEGALEESEGALEEAKGAVESAEGAGEAAGGAVEAAVGAGGAAGAVGGAAVEWPVEDIQCPCVERMRSDYPSMQSDFAQFEELHTYNTSQIDVLIQMIENHRSGRRMVVEEFLRTYDSNLPLLTAKIYSLMILRLHGHLPIISRDESVEPSSGLYNYKRPLSGYFEMMNKDIYFLTRLFCNLVIRLLDAALTSFEYCRFVEGIAYCELLFFCLYVDSEKLILQKEARDNIWFLHLANYNALAFYLYLHEHPDDCPCLGTYIAIKKKYIVKIDKIVKICIKGIPGRGSKDRDLLSMINVDANSHEYVFDLERSIYVHSIESNCLKYDEHHRWCNTWVLVTRSKKRMKQITADLTEDPERINELNEEILEIGFTIRKSIRNTSFRSLKMAIILEYLKVNAVLCVFGDVVSKKLSKELCESFDSISISNREMEELHSYIYWSGLTADQEKSVFELLSDPETSYKIAIAEVTLNLGINRWEHPTPQKLAVEKIKAMNSLYLLYFKEDFRRLANARNSEDTLADLEEKIQHMEDNDFRLFEDICCVYHCIGMFLGTFSAEPDTFKPVTTGREVLMERCRRTLFTLNILEIYLHGRVQRGEDPEETVELEHEQEAVVTVSDPYGGRVSFIHPVWLNSDRLVVRKNKTEFTLDTVFANEVGNNSGVEGAAAAGGGAAGMRNTPLSNISESCYGVELLASKLHPWTIHVPELTKYTHKLITEILAGQLIELTTCLHGSKVSEDSVFSPGLMDISLLTMALNTVLKFNMENENPSLVHVVRVLRDVHHSLEMTPARHCSAIK